MTHLKMTETTLMPLTIPDLIDNSSSERNLSNILNELLNGNVITRIATGFFNLGGYTLVREKLNQSARVSLLLGTEPSGAQSPDAGAYVPNVRDDIESDLFQAMGSGTRLEHDRVRNFLAFLQKDTVQVRLYTHHFFHAKAYILDRVPPFGTIAIVGSSNFTTAGLTANTELNMAQKQAAVAREFVQWFDRFWNESDEYKTALIELYSRAVALHPPYLIYIKTLYETFQDRNLI
jgi:phosphatidylserine/phosphatidylglycerophosphate/cardiolipin synthase-like enzyme